jgi:hypothetical protein
MPKEWQVRKQCRADFTVSQRDDLCFRFLERIKPSTNPCRIKCQFKKPYMRWMKGPSHIPFRTFCIPIGSLKRLSILPPDGPSRAEVVTYRFDVAFGGPCTCSNSMVSMNCITTKGLFGTAVGDRQNSHITWFVRDISQFSISSSSQNNRANRKWRKSYFFGRSNGGQDNLLNQFSRLLSHIWALATCRKKSHVNCNSASRDI